MDVPTAIGQDAYNHNELPLPRSIAAAVSEDLGNNGQHEAG